MAPMGALQLETEHLSSEGDIFEDLSLHVLLLGS